MIEMNITGKDINSALNMSIDLGKLNNSITNGFGNFVGFIGECCFMRFLESRNIKHDYAGNYQYDILIHPNLKIDVKTKRCKSKPRDYYEVSIANYNTAQQCTHYVFVRVSILELKCWLLGYHDKTTYFDKAVYKKKGETDSNMVNGSQFKIHADCWNMAISNLTKFKE